MGVECEDSHSVQVMPKDYVYTPRLLADPIRGVQIGPSSYFPFQGYCKRLLNIYLLPIWALLSFRLNVTVLIKYSLVVYVLLSSARIRIQQNPGLVASVILQVVGSRVALIVMMDVVIQLNTIILVCGEIANWTRFHYLVQWNISFSILSLVSLFQIPVLRMVDLHTRRKMEPIITQALHLWLMQWQEIIQVSNLQPTG